MGMRFITTNPASRILNEALKESNTTCKWSLFDCFHSIGQAWLRERFPVTVDSSSVKGLKEQGGRLLSGPSDTGLMLLCKLDLTENAVQNENDRLGTGQWLVRTQTVTAGGGSLTSGLRRAPSRPKSRRKSMGPTFHLRVCSAHEDPR